MTKNIKKLLIGASVIASFGAIASSPASAASLQNPSIGGTAPNDYLLYCADATSTFAGPTCTGSLSTILTGNAASPTGNVELAASSEKPGFNFSNNTTLNGTLNGKSITLSSLTYADWVAPVTSTKTGDTVSAVAGGTNTLAKTWLNDALSNNGFASLVGSPAATVLLEVFTTYGGMRRFSDPNISYVNQNDTTGKISIGLAGHKNATPLLVTSIEQYLAANPLRSNSSAANIAANAKRAIVAGLKTQLEVTSIQASEIVKVTYNDTTQYLYSFKATNSGLVNNKGVGADGVSHTGNYEVTLNGIPASKVPEPSAMLGLLGVGGFFAIKRKLAKKA